MKLYTIPGWAERPCLRKIQPNKQKFKKQRIQPKNMSLKCKNTVEDTVETRGFEQWLSPSED